jgi:predicted translin family RNA/ssDNA-binding protein
MADLSISKPDLKGLLSLEKRELARRVLELHDQLVRERARHAKELATRVHAIASALDYPSVYASGPRQSSLRTAERVVEALEAVADRDDAVTSTSSLPAVGSFHG